MFEINWTGDNAVLKMENRIRRRGWQLKHCPVVLYSEEHTHCVTVEESSFLVPFFEAHCFIIR